MKLLLAALALCLLAPTARPHCDPIPDTSPCGCGGYWLQDAIDNPTPGVGPYFPWYGMRTGYSTNAGQIGSTIVWSDGVDCCCSLGPLDEGDIFWTFYTLAPTLQADCIPIDSWLAVDIDTTVKYKIKVPTTVKPCAGPSPGIATEFLVVPDDPTLIGATIFRQSFIDRGADLLADRGGEGLALTFFDNRGRDVPPLPGARHTSPEEQSWLDTLAAEADARIAAGG